MVIDWFVGEPEAQLTGVPILHVDQLKLGQLLTGFDLCEPGPTNPGPWGLTGNASFVDQGGVGDSRCASVVGWGSPQYIA